MNEVEDTVFLNVDLDILSRIPLESLVEAFGQKVIVLHVGRWGRRYGARVEMADSGHQQDADRLVRRLVGLVKKLPRSSRRLWKEAQSRDRSALASRGSLGRRRPARSARPSAALPG